MKTIILTLFIACFSFLGSTQAQESFRTVQGQVFSQEDQSPLPGVNILLKGSTKGTVADEEGRFSIQIPSGEVVLSISFIGFKSQDLLVTPDQSLLLINMEVDAIGLDEVTILSTGFQELPAERATGSFVAINQELVDRRVSTNIIDRIEDIAPGLIFNRDQPRLAAGESISIRGTGSLLSSNEPLIVVDNLAYDGKLSSINPNDVASITVLKDAAAASIWGARAGNGVIVITTKKGSFESPLRVALTGNLMLGEQPDQFYLPRMSISDFVSKEVNLFNRGYYNGTINSIRNPLVSPVVEALNAQKKGVISDQELESLLGLYRSSDVRGDIEKYLQRNSMNQQYALNLSGGGLNHNYQVSAGFDKNLTSNISSGNSRFTLSTQQNWKGLKDKLQFGIGAYWVQSESENGYPEVSNLYAYDRLADENGNPLPVFRSFSQRFKESVFGLGLLNWDYYPLEEIGLSSVNVLSNDLRINTNLNYRLLPGLNISGFYQYWRNNSVTKDFDPLDSFTTRELINNFTEIGPDETLIYHVPLGSVLYQQGGTSYSHNFRTQVSYEKKWGLDHQLNLFGGGELKDQRGESFGSTSYGYNNEVGTSLPVDYLTRYRQLATGLSRNIPFTESFSGTINRFVSGFVNGGYSYKNRYLVNASARKDASNLFGVNTNQKGVPLWSMGIGWIISAENFGFASAFDYLKLRVSYGYNGNINSSATAFTTAYYLPAAQNPLVGAPFLTVSSPPNPELRWERIKIINIGLDFEVFKERLSGSIEYYTKQGLDLLGGRPLFPSSGVNQATLNYASTATKGMDLVINSRNLTGRIGWTTSFFYSLVKEEVTSFDTEPKATQLINYTPALPTPYLGKPLFGIYSFPFAGLDPVNGNPMGFVDGEPSSNYQQIYQGATPENLLYHGSGRPTSFGALRNTISYRGWNFSFNMSYRLGYYVRRPSVNMDEINRGNIAHSDYDRRWKQPGDELITTIPSDPDRVDAFRTQFFLSSGAVVEKGDHLRLQDIRISYSFSGGNNSGKLLKNLEVYTYLNNLGILWKASDELKDPDFLTNQAIRTGAVGFRIQF